MTTANTRALKYNLRAVYVTHDQLARQRRAQHCRNKQGQPEAEQLELGEPQ
jgi:hypothetical protein